MVLPSQLTSAVSVSPLTRDIEAEILRNCARSQVAIPGLDPLSSISRDRIDYERLLRLARRHGAIPLLYSGLSTTDPEAVPASVLAALHDEYRARVQRNEALTERLLQLLGALRAESIPVLTFKGPELALLWYHNPTARPYGDIDFLVDPQDVPRASVLLGSQGYRLKAGCDWQVFFVNEPGLGVDLHWKLGPEGIPDPGTFKDMWARARPVVVGSTTVTTLAAEDLFLALAVLLTRDSMYRRQRLIQICDAAALLHNPSSIDWELLLERSRRTGTRRMLLFQVALAHTLLGADLPAEMAPSLRKDSVARQMARHVGASFFAEADRQEDPAQSRPGPGFTGHSFLLQSLEQAGHKAQYLRAVTPGLLRLAVTPTVRDREFFPLPALFRSLYYVVRPARVLWRWLRTGYLILD